MAYRDFDSARDEVLKNRPRFTMGGREWTCRPKLATRTLMSIQHDYQNDSVDVEQMLRNFFSQVLVRADREPFNAMLNSEPDDDTDDDAVFIGIDQLNSCMEWLVEQYTGKAISPPEPSLNTPESTGQALRVVSLDPGSSSSVG